MLNICCDYVVKLATFPYITAINGIAVHHFWGSLALNFSNQSQKSTNHNVTDLKMGVWDWVLGQQSPALCLVLAVDLH